MTLRVFYIDFVHIIFACILLLSEGACEALKMSLVEAVRTNGHPYSSEYAIHNEQVDFITKVNICLLKSVLLFCLLFALVSTSTAKTDTHTVVKTHKVHVS